MAYIEGYFDQLSVTPGQTVRLHGSSDGAACFMRVIREGAPERLVLTVGDIKIGHHPAPPDAPMNGAGWPVCWEFTIPADWQPGVYRFDMGCTGPRDKTNPGFSLPHYASHEVLLVVRPIKPASTARILMCLTTSTYMAYNCWGGKSTYVYNSVGGKRSHRVSMLRPGHGHYDGGPFWQWERPLMQFAEREGFALEFCISQDLDRWPAGFDDYKLIVSAGHDEYWSHAMRDNVERYVKRGGNYAFFTGNTCCWAVGFEDEGRTMVTFKEDLKEDPHYATGEYEKMLTLWSHPLMKRPENALVGVGFTSGGYHRSHGSYMDGSGAMTVHRPDHWVFEGAGVKRGDTFGGPSTILGYECDGCEYEMRDGLPVPTGRDGTPRDFEILAQGPAKWMDDERKMFEGLTLAQPGNGSMGVHRPGGGGTVFAAGTTDWSHGLAADPVVQQITRNVLRRLGR